jgi:calcium/calmodulin-dependent protein kinase I
VGTLTYTAPEILLKQPHSKEVDIFSLGVVFYMLLSGILPFDDEEDSEIVR